MDIEKFIKLIKDRNAACLSLFEEKNKEYSSAKLTILDVLANFKELAKVDDVSPEEILWHLWLKHWYSVRKMVKNPEIATREMIAEKLGDTHVYMYLLEGLVTERIEAKELIQELKDIVGERPKPSEEEEKYSSELVQKVREHIIKKGPKKQTMLEEAKKVQIKPSMQEMIGKRLLTNEEMQEKLDERARKQSRMNRELIKL